MKNLSTFFLLLVASLLVFNTAEAGSKTIVDDVLLIPYCSEAPSIDGVLDDVWKSVTAIPLFKYEGGPADSAGVFDDHFSTFRAMWDDDNFYVFVAVVDQDLDGSEKASPWMSDCVELFFDGGNEKASSYDANDVQWRWVYGEVPGADGNATSGKGNWVFLDTDMGYNLELSIPADSLATLFALEADTEIGFEVSNADRDDGNGQEDVLHWWTTNGQTWADASLFGTALLTERDVNAVLNIPYTDSEPTIDGVMDEGEWDVANEMTLDLLENGVLADTVLATWKDHLSSFFTMWDENNFYVYVKVIDEDLDGSEKASPWMSDCVEIFFDGGNEKASSYDANDVQWRWVYGEVPGADGNATSGKGTWAFNVTDFGYDLELAIPADSLASLFALEADAEIGFEVSNADRDNGQGQQDVRHWWTTNGQTWADASLFGTALLVGSGGTDIGDEVAVVTDYKLQQNYPNPFNPTTKIAYSIVNSQKVNLTVYNVFGEEVAVLINRNQAAGEYSVNFDASGLASGVYFYKLSVGNTSLVKKMMLLK